jgi:hypothetical protein
MTLSSPESSQGKTKLNMLIGDVETPAAGLMVTGM